MDGNLEDFMKRFALGSSEFVEHPSKRLKIEAKQIKKSGNQQQFSHSVKVLEKFESVFDAVALSKVDKAKGRYGPCPSSDKAYTDC